jgi:subtilisin-like proprotein convertase family protein
VVSSRRRLFVVGALALALVAAACSGDDDDDDAAPDSTPSSETGSAPDDTTADTEGGQASTGAMGDMSDDDLVAVATEWIDGESGLDPALVEELQLDTVDRAMATAHVHFTQVHVGLPVLGAEYVVHVLSDGTVQGATDDLADADAATEADPAYDEAAAIDTATKEVEGTVSGDPVATQVWVEDGPGLRLAWEVRFGTVDPLGSWVIVVDATEGTVVDIATQQAERGGRYEGAAAVGAAARARSVKLAQQTDEDLCDAPPAPSGCVFLPDPIFASGGDVPGLTEANDYLTGVTFDHLTDPESGHLIGDYIDTEPRDASTEPLAEPDGVWGAGRGVTPSFEAAMTYWWVDHAQSLIQELGFTNIRNEPFHVDVIDDDVYDNSFYSPTDQEIYLGTGSDGVNEAEDATTTLHEYGHAVLDDIAGDLLFTEEGGSIHEGFGDALAYLVSLEYRPGDHACLFAWPEAGECLRRIDGDKVFPDDVVGEVHYDGEIYASFVYDALGNVLALQDLTQDDCGGSDVCNDVRDGLLAALLESPSYLTESAGLPEAGEAYINTVAAYVQAGAYGFDDAALEAVTAAAEAHGLVGGGGGGPTDTTGPTDEPPDEGIAVSVDIDHSYRGDLNVSVLVYSDDLDPLCEVELPTPDRNDSEADYRGTFDLTDSDCAQYAPPAPDQRWFLYVQDVQPEDEGEITGFAVYVDGVPYNGRNLPRPIPDDDPAGVAAIAGTEIGTTPGDDVGEPPDDAAYVTVGITHTYRGDLDVTLDVLDAAGDTQCSVIVKPAESSDPDDDVEGSVDVSDCADLLPPGPDQRWVLSVVDTAAVDVGTIDAFSITDVDGTTYEYTGSPIDIPDDDPDGATLLLDGSTGGGTMPTADAPIFEVEITHPWRGDLAVSIGLVDDTDRLLCEDIVAAPAQDDGDDLSLSVPLDDCASLYPESAGRTWVVSIADVGERDLGTVDLLRLTGTDGRALVPVEPLPADIPDADRVGLLFNLAG